MMTRVIAGMITAAALAWGAADDPLKTLRTEHPRLILLDRDIEHIRTLVQQVPLARKIHADLVKEAERLMTVPPVEYKLVGWMPVHYGYEVQIDNEPEKSGEDEYHVTGTLYSLTKPLARPGKPGPEWNTMEITLDGPHTVVVLNSVKVTDYTEGAPVPEKKFNFEPQRGTRPNEGYMGLQNHSDNDIVFFKEVAVKSVKK